MMQRRQRTNNSYHTSRRFSDRGGEGWVGPLVDYKEIELLRKFMTSSSKLMSRKRAGTNTQEQRALQNAVKLLPHLVPCADAYHAAEGADALVLATEWNQFRNLDLDRIKAALGSPIFIDLRNVYEPDRLAALGFQYTAVGRQPAKKS